MSSHKKTGINGFSTTLVNQLQFWSADVQYGICALVDEKAEKLKNLIQENAPTGKRKGKYKKSWRVKITSDRFSYYEATVHASGKEYRLTHLLEKPHASRNGGRVPARIHIKPARDQIEIEYLEGVKKIVKQSQSAGGGHKRYKK
jgi:hypothetical protein